jgi:hypothetical protein
MILNSYSEFVQIIQSMSTTEFCQSDIIHFTCKQGCKIYLQFSKACDYQGVDFTKCEHNHIKKDIHKNAVRKTICDKQKQVLSGPPIFERIRQDLACAIAWNLALSVNPKYSKKIRINSDWILNKYILLKSWPGLILSPKIDNLEAKLFQSELMRKIERVCYLHLHPDLQSIFEKYLNTKPKIDLKFEI